MYPILNDVFKFRARIMVYGWQLWFIYKYHIQKDLNSNFYKYQLTQELKPNETKH